MKSFSELLMYSTCSIYNSPRQSMFISPISAAYRTGICFRARYHPSDFFLRAVSQKAQIIYICIFQCQMKYCSSFHVGGCWFGESFRFLFVAFQQPSISRMLSQIKMGILCAVKKFLKEQQGIYANVLAVTSVTQYDFINKCSPGNPNQHISFHFRCN